jgi:hypothetical protein
MPAPRECVSAAVLLRPKSENGRRDEAVGGLDVLHRNVKDWPLSGARWDRWGNRTSTTAINVLMNESQRAGRAAVWLCGLRDVRAACIPLSLDLRWLRRGCRKPLYVPIPQPALRSRDPLARRQSSLFKPKPE